jgi:hypothetical protein
MMQGDDGGRGPQTRQAALMGLIIVLALAIAGYFLFTALRHNGELEDCLMSGRHNCAPIETPARQ